MQIFHSSQFYREYKKLDFQTKEKAKTAEKLFREDPFNPKLKTHKLSGGLKWAWAFSVSEKNRIIFEFHKKDTVCFYSIGNHSIYK